MNSYNCIKTKKIGVVLVNWNNAEHTIPCIDTLLNGIVIPDRIIVVDNASHDDSLYLIVNSFPEIDFIHSKINTGFAGGNNLAINKLIALAYDYIWVLNNDTIVEQKTLLSLMTFMNDHPEAAACSGKILYADADKRLWYAGSMYHRWSLRYLHIGEGKEDSGQYDTAEKVPFISGCCMFVRREAFELIGLFDEHFFAYSEDGDWCFRAHKKQLQLYFVPEARIWHKVSATMNKVKRLKTRGTTSQFSVYITSRNRLYLIRKHSNNFVQRCIASLIALTWFLYYAMALLLLFRIDKFKALILGIYDGVSDPLNTPYIQTNTPRFLKVHDKNDNLLI